MDALEVAGTDSPGFLFATCQIGAERALKCELQRDWPAFRFAYSRPGFLTFKLPPGAVVADDLNLGCIFARSWAFSLGKVTAAELLQRACGVWRLAGELDCDALHVWQRDVARPGWRGFEPHVTPAAVQAEMAIRGNWPPGQGVQLARHPRVAQPAQRVLDCVLVEADEWWVGWHRARGVESCYPGGMLDLEQPPDAVSRAYLKMAEALEWSALPIAAGEKIIELGCAPGGTAQALLDRGLLVIGIDPAKVDDRLLANANFTHVRKYAADVRRREFRGIAWLTADMNVAPQTTLDEVEAIVMHPSVNVRGLLLTLKLLDWNMAADIPRQIERVRGWGYDRVEARQLVHNRQEFCLMALRTRQRRRRRATAPRTTRLKRRR